jgi:ABC-type polysaccharide/polyol phosphate export permease
MLTHLANYRQYIFEAALNDIRYRYAGTSLGVFWFLIHPAVTIVVYAAVFSGLIVANPAFNPGAPFVLYLCLGLVPWLCFTETLVLGSEAISLHRLYLRRIPLPPEIFVAKSVLATGAGLGISIAFVLLLALFFGRSPTWSWLAVPIIGILLECLAFGLALLLATLRMLVRDVGELLRAILHLWTWTLPIVYPESILPEDVRGWLWLNPPYAFLHALRECILTDTWPTLEAWAAMFGWLAVALVVGQAVLGRSRSRIKDAV